MHLAPSLVRLTAVLTLSCGALACGGGDSETSQTTSTGSGGAASSGTTTGSGAGGSTSGCPEGSHTGGGGGGGDCTATLSSWTNGPAMTAARDHHVTFVATSKSGPALYVAGGASMYALFDDVERAPIGSDGKLSVFASAGKLPEGVAGPGFAQVDSGVALIGGLILSGNTTLSTTDTAVGIVGDNGSITFEAGPKLHTSRYHVSVSVDRGFVYAIGGLEQFISNGQPAQTISDAIERATFDGKKLGAFTTLAPLPHPLTHQAAVVRDHALYLFGGIQDTSVLTDIVSAEIDEKGDLGAFKKVGELPQGRATSSAFVFLDHVYVVCGATMVASGAVATVLRAPFNADGSVGAFEDLPEVPMTRQHVHQTPLFDGTIYSACGSNEAGYENQVFLGHLE